MCEVNEILSSEYLHQNLSQAFTEQPIGVKELPVPLPHLKDLKFIYVNFHFGTGVYVFATLFSSAELAIQKSLTFPDGPFGIQFALLFSIEIFSR